LFVVNLSLLILFAISDCASAALGFRCYISICVTSLNRPHGVCLSGVMSSGGPQNAGSSIRTRRVGTGGLASTACLRKMDRPNSYVCTKETGKFHYLRKRANCIITDFLGCVWFPVSSTCSAYICMKFLKNSSELLRTSVLCTSSDAREEFNEKKVKILTFTKYSYYILPLLVIKVSQ